MSIYNRVVYYSLFILSLYGVWSMLRRRGHSAQARARARPAQRHRPAPRGGRGRARARHGAQGS